MRTVFSVKGSGNNIPNLIVSGITHVSVQLNTVRIVDYIYNGFIYFLRRGNIRISKGKIEHILGSVLSSHLLSFFKHCPDYRAALHKAFHFT